VTRWLLLLAVALQLGCIADAGHAAADEVNVEIVAIDLAGRQTNLTRNAAVDVGPAVSCDGRIVFVSTRGGSGADLYVMAADGSAVARLTNGALDQSGVAWSEALEVSQAAWSRRGDRIAFDGQYAARGRDCSHNCAGWDVLVIGADGSGLERVALDARAPAWSRDGRSLAYASDVDAYTEAGSVTVMRLDGSGSVRVRAVNPDSEVGPLWSPRGGEIAFQARPTGAARSWIYVVRADGSRKRRLAQGHDPAWSADGRRLAFIDDYKLMTIGRDGRGRRRLSRRGEFVVGAAWSPKRSLLGYVAGTKAPRHGGSPTRFRVETVSADGKRARVLRREPAGWGIWGEPVWTPDGKRILVTVEPD
jgi:Tol biopolymer transport system component